MVRTAETAGLAERVQAGAMQQGNGGGNTVLTLLGSPKMRDQLAQALPRAMDPDRFLRVVLTELRRNPELTRCTLQSFLGALMTAAQLGLEPGPLGHSYLLPFRNRSEGTTECQLILGYKGLIDLARRSGNVVNIVAREVCEADEFAFEYGLEEKLVHKPSWEDDRGKPVAYYGVAHYKDGGHLIMVLSKADVDKFRKRSKASQSGPWVTDYDAMAKKTVIRRMATFMPLSVQAAIAVVEDEQRELGLDVSESMLTVVEAPAAGSVDSEEAPAAEPLGDSAHAGLTLEGSAG